MAKNMRLNKAVRAERVGRTGFVQPLFLSPSVAIESLSMSQIYIARSRAVQKWGAEVGLTAHLYKVGVTDEDPEAVIDGFNKDSFAGETDWKLVKAEEIADLDEAAVLEKLGRKEKMADPGYYPKLRGATGILKVTLKHVQSRLLVQQMMEGAEEASAKPKPAEIADYLIQNAKAS
jgi:hypothetical protein